MRKLTFEGFLKQYVAELSGIQTASVHKLADCLSENLSRSTSICSSEFRMVSTFV